MCSKVDIETTTSIELSSNGNLYGSAKTTSTFGPSLMSTPIYLKSFEIFFLILELTSLVFTIF